MQIPLYLTKTIRVDRWRREGNARIGDESKFPPISSLTTFFFFFFIVESRNFDTERLSFLSITKSRNRNAKKQNFFFLSIFLRKSLWGIKGKLVSVRKTELKIQAHDINIPQGDSIDSPAIIRPRNKG